MGGLSKNQIDQISKEVAFENQISKLKSEVTQQKNKAKILEKSLTQTIDQLDIARERGRFLIPDRTKKKKPKTYLRLVIPDTHGNHADLPALNAMLSDIDGMEIREVVMLGDHLDCGGFLMMNHTLGYVAEMDETHYEEDIGATSELIDKLQAVCPSADFHYLEGNHEQRVERWVVDASKGNSTNAKWLLKQVGPQNVLKLKKRGIKYYGSGECHMGITQPGIIKLGKTYFTHGIFTSQHAAMAHAKVAGACIMYGHTHRTDMFMGRLIDQGMIGAWNPGCLCKLNARYKHSNPANWNHGYLLQIIDRDTGNFHAIPVPIDNGKSYLLGLLKALG